MHPELYQVIYRQQEREREILLRRRLVVAERASTTPAPSRRTGRKRPRWFGAARFVGRRGSEPEYRPTEPCATA
jgi:hypothetical protein